MQSEQIFEAKGCCSRLIAPAMTTLKSFIARNLWKQEQHHPNMANFFDWSSFSCTNDFVTRVHILVIEGNCCHIESSRSEISTIGSKMAYDENTQIKFQNQDTSDRTELRLFSVPSPSLKNQSCSRQPNPGQKSNHHHHLHHHPDTNKQQ